MRSYLRTKFPVLTITDDRFKKIASSAIAIILISDGGTSWSCYIDTKAKMVIAIFIINEIVTKYCPKFCKTIACKALSIASAFRANFAATE